MQASNGSVIQGSQDIRIPTIATNAIMLILRKKGYNKET